jgi:hypothetical protein
MSSVKLLHPAGGRLFGPDFRPEVVPESGEKAVEGVERWHPTPPRTYRKLGEAPVFPQPESLTYA